MPLTEEHQNLLTKISRLRKEVAEEVVGREKVTDIIIRALMSGQHVMVIGTHGVAKSMLVRAIYDRIECKQFSAQLHQEATSEHVFGPIDMRKYREDATFRHNTSGTLLDCHLAYLDEFMDSPWNLRRAMLEVLMERQFTKGSHNETIPLWSVVATTNFSGGGDKDAAVLDRFLYVLNVDRLGASDRTEMIKGAARNRFAQKHCKPVLSLDDLYYAHALCKSVEISDEFIEDYSEVISKVCDKLPNKSMWPSDRKVVQALDAIRVSVILDGRTSADTQKDLGEAVYGLFAVGAEKQQQAFSLAYSEVLAETEAREFLRKSTHDILIACGAIKSFCKNRKIQELNECLDMYAYATTFYVSIDSMAKGKSGSAAAAINKHKEQLSNAIDELVSYTSRVHKIKKEQITG